MSSIHGLKVQPAATSWSEARTSAATTRACTVAGVLALVAVATAIAAAYGRISRQWSIASGSIAGVNLVVGACGLCIETRQTRRQAARQAATAQAAGGEGAAAPSAEPAPRAVPSADAARDPAPSAPSSSPAAVRNAAPPAPRIDPLPAMAAEVGLSMENSTGHTGSGAEAAHSTASSSSRPPVVASAAAVRNAAPPAPRSDPPAAMAAEVGLDMAKSTGHTVGRGGPAHVASGSAPGSALSDRRLPTLTPLGRIARLVGCDVDGFEVVNFHPARAAQSMALIATALAEGRQVWARAGRMDSDLYCPVTAIFEGLMVVGLPAEGGAVRKFRPLLAAIRKSQPAVAADVSAHLASPQPPSPAGTPPRPATLVMGNAAGRDAALEPAPGDLESVPFDAVQRPRIEDALSRGSLWVRRAHTGPFTRVVTLRKNEESRFIDHRGWLTTDSSGESFTSQMFYIQRPAA